MVQQAAGAAGPADPQVVALIQGVSDKRVAMATALARFEATLLKSDALGDDDSSAGAKGIREKTPAEEARLLAARAELKVAENFLATYGIAVHGASAPLPGATSSSKLDDEDALEKKENMMMGKKLPSPKNGWKDVKGMIIQMYSDRNTLYRQFFNIFWKLRNMVRDQAAAAPDASNVSERALGVRRANQPDPDDFADKLEAMIVCKALKLGLNQLYEVACCNRQLSLTQ
jgi:hypothetical protein